MSLVNITLQRSDFRIVGDGEEVDFFADIAIRLGLATSYDDAYDIDEIEFDLLQQDATAS